MTDRRVENPMYTPTFTLTHRMVNYLIKLELAIRTIKETPLSTQVQRELLKQMQTENIYHLGRSIDAKVSMKEAAQIAEAKDIPTPGTPAFILSNYRSTRDFIYSSANDRYFTLSPSLLLHLNKLLFTRVVDQWDAGRFRNPTDEIKVMFDLWEDARQQDVHDVEFQQHFYQVLNWFTERKYRIHSALKLGCVVYELMRIYPFVSGNQLTMLATSELLFEKTKLSLSTLFPMTRHFNLNAKEYKDVLQQSIEAQDLTMWLERFIKGLAVDMTALKNDVLRLDEEKVKGKKKQMQDLNQRQLKLLRQLRHKPKISRKEYVDMLGVSTMTAYRDLNELVDKKLVVVRGGGRSTFYRLPDPNLDKTEATTQPKKEVVKVIGEDQPDFSGVKDPFNATVGSDGSVTTPKTQQAPQTPQTPLQQAQSTPEHTPQNQPWTGSSF